MMISDSQTRATSSNPSLGASFDAGLTFFLQGFCGNSFLTSFFFVKF